MSQDEAAARVAAIVRALPDTALCALLDAMQWAMAQGHDAEIVQTVEDETAIQMAIEEATTDYPRIRLEGRIGGWQD